MEAYEYINVTDTVRIAVHTDTDLMEPEQYLPDGAIVFRRSSYQDDKPELPELTRAEIKANARAVCEATNTRTLIECSRAVRCYGGATATEYINETIQDMYSSGSYDETIAALYMVCTIKGYQIVQGTSCGYCQRDWIDYFIALPNTPDDPTSVEYAQGIQQEYAAWAFGDGYGYVIEELIDDEWEDTDCACWGFYGELNGGPPDYMVEDAKENAQYVIKDIAAREQREYFNSVRHKLARAKYKHGRATARRAAVRRVA